MGCSWSIQNTTKPQQVATPQIILNYASFLEEHSYFEVRVTCLCVCGYDTGLDTDRYGGGSGLVWLGLFGLLLTHTTQNQTGRLPGVRARGVSLRVAARKASLADLPRQVRQAVRLGVWVVDVGFGVWALGWRLGAHAGCRLMI